MYSALRLLAFFVPFGIMMLFPLMRELYWLSAIFAAVIGLSLSLLFLRGPLEQATAGLAPRSRAHSTPSEEEFEDAELDAAETSDRDRP